MSKPETTVPLDRHMCLRILKTACCKMRTPVIPNQ